LSTQPDRNRSGILAALFIAIAAVALMVALSGKGGVEFQTDAGQAMAQAARENKPVMVDVYTDWCTWCHKLDRDVYSRNDVAQAVDQNFVALKLNPEKSASEKAFAAKYKVEGFPTILFLDANGKELGRVLGSKPGPEFLKTLAMVHSNAPA
jgi:thiol:disulfide interchange protein